MKKQKKSYQNQLLISLAIVIVFVIGAYWYVSETQKIERQPVTEGTKVGEATPAPYPIEQYKNLQFSIVAPVGWAEDASGKFGALRQYINPVEDQDGESKLSANINIIAEQTSLAFDEYIRSSRETLPKILPDYNAIDDRRVSLAGGHGAQIFGGTFTQNGVRLRNRQLITVDNGYVYIVTATALESSWSKYDADVRKSLLSFVF